jgi:hypothetical protein
LLRILSASLVLLAFSGTAYPGAPAGHRPPSSEIAAKLRAAFERASEIELFTAPANQMDRLGYSKEGARAHAHFFSVVLCRQCEIASRALLDELSNSRRIRGNCPGPISAVIELHDADHKSFAAIYFSSRGKCFEFQDQAYKLRSRSLPKKIETLAETSD